MCVEHNEAVRPATKYHEDLYKCKIELKEATEMARSHDESLFALEKERVRPT